MKDLSRLLLIVGILVVVIGSFVAVKNRISLASEIEGVKDRAQVAATADEIMGRLIVLDQRMEDRGMEKGYTSLFVHSPWTDVSEIRANVKRLISRASIIAELDPSSDAYQQGLDDVRGTLRELDLQTWGWWTYNARGWVFLLLIPLGAVLFIVSRVLAAEYE